MNELEKLKELNQQQLQAVTHKSGPVLVIGGAGSGKTRTLAYRVAHLISQGVQPANILLLTFTRRAAKEMLSRASQALGQQSNLTTQVWGGTFHAIANRLLRKYSSALNLQGDFTIIDQSDAEDLLDIVRHKKLAGQKKGRFPRKTTLLSIYSRRMNTGEPLNTILKKDFPWCQQWQEELKSIYKEYTQIKIKQNILDYDDLLVYWYHLLGDNEISEILNKRFEHILVDEYQDTNKLQAQILKRMRNSNFNVMAVGDDAQSIYSFRGATVRNMLDFPKHFPQTTLITLEQNYRSTESILNTTNILISQAKDRFAKTLFTKRTEGQHPEIITCKDEQNEADIAIEKILEHYESGISLRNQAILFRAGSHSAAVEIALMKKNIPFHKYGGLKFLEAAHIKDFISYVRIIENRNDEMAWFRILQLFGGVGPATASKIFETLKTFNMQIESIDKADVPPAIKKDLQRLKTLITGIEQKASPLCSQLEKIGHFYTPLLENNYENAQPRKNDIEQIIQLASEYKSRSQFLTDIVLDPPSSTSDLAGPPKKDEDFLTLSTIHSAKGCEWDSVYLIHAADGCLPSDMSTDSTEAIEEELRLTYVALTRAKQFLYVLWPLRFYSRPQGFSDRHVYSQCSRFFSEDVLDTMTSSAETENCQDENESSISSRIDIKDELSSFWD